LIVDDLWALRANVWVILVVARVEEVRTPLRCLDSGLVEGFGSRWVQRRAFHEGMGWAARGRAGGGRVGAVRADRVGGR
jgi:hypothetical protein